MLQENNHPIVKKRALKKLRPQFLHKKDESEEQKAVDPSTKYLGENLIVLKASVGLAEVNHKIYNGPQYMNPHLTISDSRILNQDSNRLVKLDFVINPDNSPLPWEYVIKRLESYGDLDLATMAHRIAKFYINFQKIMSKYYESLHTNNLIMKKFWKDTKEKAIEACKEIEKNDMFYVVRLHFTRDSDQLVSASFSEGLLEAVGFTPENFIDWSGKNGMTNVFDPECLACQNAIKTFFEFTSLLGSPIYKSQDYETLLCDIKGAKTKIIVQTINILEPVSDGFLSHYYFVVKGKVPSSPENDELRLAVGDGITDKCLRKDSDEEISDLNQKSIKAWKYLRN